MKILLVIPSVLKTGIDSLVKAGDHPMMDYYALAAELRRRGADVEFLDYKSVAGTRLPIDAALAIEASKRAARYSVIFTNSESVSIPLALLLRLRRQRPKHVTIAHKLTSGKKSLFFRNLKVQNEIDTLFVYADTQQKFGAESLGIDSSKLRLIAFHADTQFFYPIEKSQPIALQFCSVGLEWRDYPTLIESAKQHPHCTFKIAAASPWSKHRNELEGQELPPNVTARPYNYGELRNLYAESKATIVPLYENDFQAGVTTILESMSMGRPVIATRTIGQKDVIIDGETGIYVRPGDPAALTEAITRLVNDDSLCSKIGARAREWVVDNASLIKWSNEIADSILPADR